LFVFFVNKAVYTCFQKKARLPWHLRPSRQVSHYTISVQFSSVQLCCYVCTSWICILCS